MPIQRLTFFKVPDPANIPAILASYQILKEKNSKDGRSPYILEVSAYEAKDDARSQGYRVVGMTKFENLEDMKYYDTECEAHKNLKQSNAGKMELPPLTVYFEE